MSSALRATLAVAVLLALVPLASATAAAPKAKDGYWRTNASDQLVELRVSDHQVVAVLAAVQTTTTGSPDNECGSQSYAFLGPFSGTNRTSGTGFSIASGPTGWAVKGKVVSATKITGTVQVFASSRNQCEAKTKFTATYTSKK